MTNQLAVTIISEFAFPVDHFRESTAVRLLFVWRISFQLSPITSVVSGRSLVIKAVFRAFFRRGLTFRLPISSVANLLDSSSEFVLRDSSFFSAVTSLFGYRSLRLRVCDSSSESVLRDWSAVTFTFRLPISSAASLLDSSSESVLRDWSFFRR